MASTFTAATLVAAVVSAVAVASENSEKCSGKFSTPYYFLTLQFSINYSYISQFDFNEFVFWLLCQIPFTI